MNLGELGKQAVDTLAYRGNQLQQRLGVIRSNTRMGQRRAKAGRVRRVGQAAVSGNAQAFLFNTVQTVGQQGVRGRLRQQIKAISQQW